MGLEKIIRGIVVACSLAFASHAKSQVVFDTSISLNAQFVGVGAYTGGVVASTATKDYSLDSNFNVTSVAPNPGGVVDASLTSDGLKSYQLNGSGIVTVLDTVVQSQLGTLDVSSLGATSYGGVALSAADNSKIAVGYSVNGTNFIRWMNTTDSTLSGQVIALGSAVTFKGLGAYTAANSSVQRFGTIGSDNSIYDVDPTGAFVTNSFFGLSNIGKDFLLLIRG